MREGEGAGCWTTGVAPGAQHEESSPEVYSNDEDDDDGDGDDGGALLASMVGAHGYGARLDNDEPPPQLAADVVPAAQRTEWVGACLRALHALAQLAPDNSANGERAADGSADAHRGARVATSDASCTGRAAAAALVVAAPAASALAVAAPAAAALAVADPAAAASAVAAPAVHASARVHPTPAQVFALLKVAMAADQAHERPWPQPQAAAPAAQSAGTASARTGRARPASVCGRVAGDAEDHRLMTDRGLRTDDLGRHWGPDRAAMQRHLELAEDSDAVRQRLQFGLRATVPRPAPLVYARAAGARSAGGGARGRGKRPGGSGSGNSVGSGSRPCSGDARSCGGLDPPDHAQAKFGALVAQRSTAKSSTAIGHAPAARKRLAETPPDETPADDTAPDVRAIRARACRRAPVLRASRCQSGVLALKSPSRCAPLSSPRRRRATAAHPTAAHPTPRAPVHADSLRGSGQTGRGAKDDGSQTGRPFLPAALTNQAAAAVRLAGTRRGARAAGGGCGGSSGDRGRDSGSRGRSH